MTQPYSDTAAAFAVSRCRDHLKQLRQRYPAVLGELHQAAGRRGSSPEMSWPDWCWLPMAAPASILPAFGLRAPADIARTAALATWRLGQGVYTLTDEHFDTVAPEGGEITTLTDPVDGMLARLPDQCPYIVLGQPRLAGVYVHAEYDVARGGRPELRLLVDTGDAGEHGDLDELAPIAVYAEPGPVISPTNQEIAALADGLREATDAAVTAAGALLLHRNQPSWGQTAQKLLGRLLVYVACLVDPDVEIYAPDAPATSPSWAEPDGRGRWVGASGPRVWRVGFRAPPELRVVR